MSDEDPAGGNLRLEDGRLFNHGGSGIVLSRAALQLLVHGAPGCLAKYGRCWAGDGMLGLCLHSLGVQPQRGDGLCGDSPFDFLSPEANPEAPLAAPPPEHCVAPRPVTYHRIRTRRHAALLSEHDALQRRSPAPVSLRAFLHHAGRGGRATPLESNPALMPSWASLPL